MANKYWWRDDEKETDQQDKSQTTQTTSKTGNKYWWRDEEDTTAGDSGHNQQSVGNTYWWRADDASTAAENITNRLNTWLQNHNTYIFNYQKRNSGRKYNYEDAYVSDSADWLNTVTQQKNNFDAEADSILSYMDQYKDFFNADWVKAVRETLASARGTQSQILDNYTKDNQWWSNFENEDAYKYAGRADGYSKKYDGMTYENIQAALDDLPDGEERQWLQYMQGDLFNDYVKGQSDYQQYAQKGAGMNYASFDPVEQGAIMERGNEYLGAISALFNHFGTEKKYGGHLQSYVDLFQNLTEDEWNVLAYSVAKDRENGFYTDENGVAQLKEGSMVEQFLRSMEGSLEQSAGEKEAARYKDIPVIADLYAAKLGLSNFATGFNSFVNNNDTGYGSGTTQVAGSIIRESFADDGFKLPEWMGGASARQALFDLTSTTSQQIPTIAVSSLLSAINPALGTIAGTSLMGTSAAGNAYSEALDKGYGKKEARLYGSAVGILEGTLQYLLGGISKLGGVSSKLATAVSGINSGLARFALQYGGQMASEGLEEGLQEILDPLLQRAIMDADADIDWSQVTYSALLGALSAGTLEIATTVQSVKEQTRENNAFVSEYGGLAKDVIKNGTEGSKIGKIAEKYQKKLGKGKNLTASQVRKVLESSAQERLTELGEDGNTAKIATMAVKYASGQELTRAEKKELSHSKFGAQVSKEIRASAMLHNWMETAAETEYESLESRMEDEAPAKVSDTGVAVISGTDQQVDLTAPKIKKITKDSVILEVDGKDVNIDEIDFANEDQWNMFNALKKVEHITPDVASDMIAKIDTSKPIWGQMNGMDEAFTYGYWNYSEADLKAGLFAGNLTKEQLNDAYKLGQYVRQHDVEADEANRKKMRTAFEAKMSQKEQAAQQKARIESDDVDVYFMDGKSTVKFDEHTGKYDNKRMAAVNTAKFLKKLGIGGKFVFYESYEKNGNRYYKDENGNEVEAPNGFYDPADGSIYIDLNAGNDGSGTALFTMGHELAHFVKHRSEKQFKILADLVTEAFDKTDMSMRERVLAKQKFLEEKRGKKVDYSEAYEEVVADAMSTMLTDGSFYDILMEIKVKNKDLFATIKKFFTDFIAKFKREYEKLTPDQKDAQDIRELKDCFDKVQRAFAEGLVEAGENFRAEQTQKNTTEEGDVKYEIREIGNTGKFYVQADRQVLTGDDPSLWGKQIENYINEQIRKEQDMAIPTSDGHILLLTRRSAYKLSDQAVSSIGSKIRNMLSSENFALKGRAATHIDELIQVARYEDYKADEDGKHENDIGEDGFTYYYAFFRDFDGQYYRIPFSAGVNAQEETAYSIGKITKRRLPAGLGSSSNEALENGRKPSGAIIYSSEAKSQEVKTALQLAYEKALKQKGDKAEASQEATATDEVGMEVDAKTESVAPKVMNSERTWTESEYVQERDKAAKEIAKAIGVTEQKAKDYIDSVNSIAKMIAEDRSRLDYFSSPNRTSFVGNVEYGGSFDFSTLCKKRRLLTGTFTAIQKALPNTALTADEILDIRNRMKEANLEVSCGLCYVEGSRANMGQFAKEFLRLYKQYYPDAWQPNMADVNTPDGIEWVRINHPECYEQYEYFWNHYGTLKEGDKNLFASQQKPKLYQLHTEYKGEILNKFKDDDNVEEKNLNGGIRLQSFSDFEIVHLIDTMQIIMDMSRVGLAGQAYTKVPDFAWALGDTGLKINLSLIAKGVDENGKLIFDDVEGMPIADAIKLRDRYSKNVGTILVAFNDEQLLAAMADERVDFIIPFHRSQWKKSQYEAMGLPAKTKDYTFMQNEKYIKPQFHEYRGRMVKDKATNYMPNEYWDFSKSGKENAEAYLEMCARNNKRPKFYKLLQNNGDGSYSLKADGTTDGYWKLLIDFKMYDNEGTGSPQMAVKPEFNMEEANRMLNDYKGGHSNFPVAQGIVDGFVKDYKSSHKGQKFSERGTAQKDRDYMEAANRGDKAVAKKMVDQYAIEQGFDVDEDGEPDLLFHGTDSFGFTKIDNSASDDGITFWATPNMGVAGSYYEGSNYRVREIGREKIAPKGERISNTSSMENAIKTAMPFADELGQDLSKIKYTKEAKVMKQARKSLQRATSAAETVLRGDFSADIKKIAENIVNASKQNTYDAWTKAINQLRWQQYEDTTGVDFSELDLGNKFNPDKADISQITDANPNVFKMMFHIGDALNAISADNFGTLNGETVFKDDVIAPYNDLVSEKGVYGFYHKQDNPFVYDCRGSDWDNIKVPAEAKSAFNKGVTTTRQLAAWAFDNGYDAIRFDNLVDVGGYALKEAQAPATIWAFKNPQNQLKSADPITYDDNGDVIPLSQRFNTENDDIRYSERGEDSSNRSLLANAFEGITKSSIEYKMIQEYKSHIKDLNALDKELGKINAEIREIRFTKGKYDAKKLSALESKATAIANEITRHDRELLSLEASEPLRKVIQRERKKEAQKTKAHVQEIQQNKKDRAEQTELRHKIRKTIRDLDKILNRGNKKLNVKEDMKGFASKALELADYLFTDHISNDDLIRKGITVRMTPKEAALVKETEDILSKLYDHADSLTNEEFTQLDAQRKKNLNKLRDLLTAQRNERLNTPVYNLFSDLVTEYAGLKNSKQDAVKDAYNPEVERFLRSYIGESNGETDSDRKTLLQNMRVADMTTDELWKLYNAYKMVLHSVRTANELFVKGKTETLEQKASRIMGDFANRKIPDKKVAIIARNIANKIGWDYEKLYYALDRIGSEAFTELVTNIANSENIVMQDIMEAVAFRDEMIKKYGFNNWAVNKEIDREFLDNTGKKFKLTLGQLMALYAYSRRDGAWDHIEYGGFVFGESALTNPKPADSYKLSKAQCEAITGLLTKEQKGYAEDMQKFLSETMGEKGNEVSMLLYGIKMFGEKNYFPIHVAGQFKAQAQESQAKAAAGFSSMSNAGFTHAQNPNAKAPFVLEGFNEIWADHVNEMSRYHGTVPALEDMRRVMNRSFYSESGMESMAIKQLMENAYGKEAVDYFDTLYREANSGAITDKLQQKQKKLLSLFRKNSVAYSLSVVIQQPSAMSRAYAMIDKKYFGFKGVGALASGVAKAVSSKWNPAYANAYNEMKKYAPGVTMAKEIGGFDTHTGSSIREYLLDTGKSFKQSMQTENLKGKAKAALDLVDNNAIANLPTVADKIAWIEIWNACKRETLAKHRDLAPNSEEFMQAVGERFTEVIRATQVYDSMFSKSPMLRSKNLAVQYLVSFMNEPNTTANMVEKAVRDAIKGDWKSGVRTAAAVTSSIIFNNVLKAVIYAMRDDDEDETYIEKYADAIASGMIADFNPLSYIPYVRDVVSKLQGYDVERPDMAIVTDAIEAYQAIVKNANKDTENLTEYQLAELDKKVTDASWKLVGSLAAFFGIPLKNIYREAKGVLDHVRIASANAGMTTPSSVWDKVTASIPFLESETAKADKLYEAIVSGDKAYIDRLKAGYVDKNGNFDQGKYDSAVVKALRENDPRIHDAAQAGVNGNSEERNRIFKEIKAEMGAGYANLIIDAINSEANAIRNDAKPDKVAGQYEAYDFVEAVSAGDANTAKAVREDIISTYVANGKTQTEAENAFKTDVKSSVSEAYSYGTITKATAEKMLVEYADMDEEDAADKITYWDFCKTNPNCDLNESKVLDYLEFAEPAHVSLDVYEQFVAETKDLADIKDKWGDVEVTKREQVLEVIDSLPLSWQQKDALYLAYGYAESKIWDVPW